MGLIITCIVGGLIGALAGMITGKDFPLGIVGNVIAGLIGSWVGSALFGHWGPEWGGIFILPALWHQQGSSLQQLRSSRCSRRLPHRSLLTCRSQG